MTNIAEDLLWISQVVIFQNKNAFEKLVVKYQSPLRRFLLNLTNGDKELSDDLSQETFIKAYLRLSTFKGTSKFSTWLFRIGYNEFYDAVRAKKIKISLNDDDHDLQQVNELSASDHVSIDAQMDLKEALGVLRSEERTAVLLVYMEGYTHHQVAEIMNCPLGTVKSYILRGKNKLHEFFKEEAYGTKQV
jgi:RNA polymerase sigma-70 factor (ECF subfamily)